MNILIISDGIIYRVNNNYCSYDTFLKFILNFKLFFNKVIIFAPTFQKFSERRLFFILKEDNYIQIENAFPYNNVLNFYKKLPKILIYNFSRLKKHILNSNAVFLRIPAMNSFLAAVLAYYYKKPIVCYFVGDEEEVVKNGNKYKGFKKYLAIFIAKVHSFLYKKISSTSKVSFFLSSNLKNKFASNSNNAFFIFTSLVEEKDINFRNNYQFKFPITLVFVGRLSHEKGIDYLIKAVKMLRNENFYVKLLICGEGPEKKKLESLIQKLNLNNYVNFLGFIPWGEKLFKIYDKSDVFILPSLSEGVPKVLLEAMARGLPIIATNVGGIPDIVKHKENGILIPPKSSEAIVDAVKLLINDIELRKRLIENGYKFIKEHTAEKQAQKIAEIIYKYCK